MLYKNCSYTAKTFYGVTFKPGETKQVDGIINVKWMVPVDDSATNISVVQKEPSSEPLKEVEPKPVEPEPVQVEEPKEEEMKQESKPSSGKGKKS